MPRCRSPPGCWSTGTARAGCSCLPLSWLLHDVGWTPTFLAAGLASVITGAAVLLVLAAGPRPARRPREVAALLSAVRAVDHRVRSAWALPGTRAGFWVHFTSMSTALTFGVLCGVPFLVQAQVLSRDAASALLLVSVLGWYLVLGVFTGTIPRWLRVALVLITAAGTPISSIGFAVARDYNGPTTVGTRHALLRALDLGHSAPVAIVRHRWGLS